MPKAFDISLEAVLPADNPYGGAYTLNIGSCTGLDDKDVYDQTGFTILGLFNARMADVGWETTLASVIVWLVRRRQFTHLEYGDVARTITWGSDFDVHDADPESEGKVSGSEDSPKT